MVDAQIFSGKRILFCDDDPFFAEMGADCLQGAGFQVTQAANGQEALGLVGRQPFDLMVLDLHMPGISGFAVLEEIRSSEATKDLPVMVVTGNDDGESVQRAFNLCADSFLAKPFDWSLLVHQVRFVLKAAKFEDELRAEKRASDVIRKTQQDFVANIVGQTEQPLEALSDIVARLSGEAPGTLSVDAQNALIDELAQVVEYLQSSHLRLSHHMGAGAVADRMETSEFNIAPCLSSIAVWIDGQANEKNFDFVTVCNVPELVRVRYDRVLLAEAIKDMICFSVDAGENGARLEIRCDYTEDDGITVSVKNGGHQSGDDAEPAKGEGEVSSLGEDSAGNVPFVLRMAQGIAEAHGGSFSISERTPYSQVVRLIIPAERVFALKSVAEPMIADEPAEMSSAVEDTSPPDMVEQTDQIVKAEEQAGGETAAADLNAKPAVMPAQPIKKFGGGLRGKASFGNLQGRKAVKSV